jgi:hypothetical protein
VIGQLSPDFFHKFFAILDSPPGKTLALEEKINDLCQRQWMKEQLDALPAMERETFDRIVNEADVSASTLNDFLEQRLEQDERLALWEQAQLKLWAEILKVVEEVATPAQRQKIKELISSYRG